MEDFTGIVVVAGQWQGNDRMLGPKQRHCYLRLLETLGQMLMRV
jgi:hypothetical protein